MSDRHATVRVMFHPWRRLRSKPAVDLSWRPMPNRLGVTDGESFIVMDPRQSQAQRRCTVTHELAHIELGHTAGCNPEDERAARDWAARRLITIDMLAEAIVWAMNEEELSDDLWVDVETVRTRLAGLTEAETQHIEDVIARREQGA